MPSTQDNNSDEIDLRDLMNFISKGIGNFFGKILDFIALIRSITIQNFKLFIITIIVFLVSIFSYNQLLRKDIYGSYMLIRSGYLNNQLVDNTILKLNSLAEEKDKSTLSKTLDIDIDIANQISGFEVLPFVTDGEVLEVELLKEKLLNLKVEDDIITNIIDKIKIRNPNTFKITVLTETNSVMETLDSAIAKYFLQDQYIKKRIEINRVTLVKRKAKLEKEQLKIDSLKNTIFEIYQSLSKNQSQGSDNVILAGQEVTNPLDVFRTDLKINDDILAIERQLFLKNEFEVIEGLTPFSKPVSISIIRLAAYTILIAIGFTYALLILIGFNRLLAQRAERVN